MHEDIHPYVLRILEMRPLGRASTQSMPTISDALTKRPCSHFSNVQNEKLMLLSNDLILCSMEISRIMISSDFNVYTDQMVAPIDEILI
jgi:hypothetical protein